MATQEFLMEIRHFGRKFGGLVRALEASEATDGQLIESYVGGQDQAAFAAIVRRHGSMVLGVCLRLLANVQDAEDAFQATFVVLARRAGSLQRPHSLAGWLYGVAVRSAMKARTSRHRRSKEKQVDPMLNDRPSAEASNWREVNAVLDEELEHLPEQYRVVVVLCDLEGKSRKEAASHLKVPEGTVSSRLSAGRKMLAKRLSRRGITLSAMALATALAHNVAKATVSQDLMVSTFHCAVAGTGAVGTGGMSAAVASLADAVLKGMFLSKLRSTVAIVLMAAMVASGFVYVGANVLSAQPSQGAVARTAFAQDGEPQAGKDVPKKIADESPKEANPAKSYDQERERLMRGSWRIFVKDDEGRVEAELNLNFAKEKLQLHVALTPPAGKIIRASSSHAVTLQYQVSENDGQPVLLVTPHKSDKRVVVQYKLQDDRLTIEGGGARQVDLAGVWNRVPERKRAPAADNDKK